MKIQRTIMKKLVAWKNNPRRKPLVLQGARQVGKTWVLKQLGAEEFEDMAYFNFEEQPQLKQFFQNTKNVPQIVQNLSLVHGRSIQPHRTLIIFDEIQECNEALNALKYFYENAPEYAVASAGSLLGVALSRGQSFPVGKVTFLQINPLTFSEFLSVTGPELHAYLDGLDRIEALPDLFFNPLIDKLKLYFITGGMPESVATYVETGSISIVQNILQDILNAYTLDFSKYAPDRDVPRIQYIWSSIPSQLARDNKKFLYQAVKDGARAREYEQSLQWLADAGLIHKVFRINKPALPLSAYADLSAFKIYQLDVALLRRLSMLDPIAVTEGNRLFTEFKGALTENYILQHLIADFEGTPHYWTSGNQAEIDFTLQYKNDLIPIEVKADENVRSRSLSVYYEKYKPDTRIRYSLKNLQAENGLINIPLFMVDWTEKLLSLK